MRRTQPPTLERNAAGASDVPIDSTLCKQCQEFKLHELLHPNKPSYLEEPNEKLIWSVGVARRLYDSNQPCELCRVLLHFIEEAKEEPVMGTVCLTVNSCLTVRFPFPDHEERFLGVDISPGPPRYLYPIRGHAAPSYVSGNQLGPKANLEIFKRWTTYCRLRHTNCPSAKRVGLAGFRVIDCKTREICEIAPDEKYVALSYVWGPPGQPTTEPSTTQFPQTIEDAITVTSGLGMRYLWVDKYCINQDDAEEKHNLIQNMNRIYVGADLTIIAAAGSNASYGLPGVSKTAQRQQDTVKLGGLTFASTFDPKHEIEGSPWAQRGWTYQEVMLSRRRLVFMDSQVYFQCAQSHCMETIGRKTLLPFSNPALEQDKKTALRRKSGNVHCNVFWDFRSFGKSQKIWDDIERYYVRKLTFEKDRLDAFDGIFSSSYKSKGYWGIPIPRDNGVNKLVSFLGSLAWRVEGQHEQASLLSFPSWSWASLRAGKLDAGLARTIFDSEERQAFGRLVIKTRIQPQQTFLRDTAVKLTRLDGSCIDLVSYAKERSHYRAFHPWIELTCWTSTTHNISSDGLSTKRISDESGNNTIYLDPGEHIQEGVELAIIYLVGTIIVSDPLGFSRSTPHGADVAFLLTRKNEHGNFRRVGLWEARTMTTRLVEGPRFQSVFMPDWLNAMANEAKDLKLGPLEWEKKTVRLV